jgi:tetratricopeptide (TPR) repeat protein
MAEIQKQSGIVYIVGKVIDQFPIYFADIEKSYILALLKNHFANKRLEKEKDKISARTLQFEKELARGPRDEAVVSFVEGLKAEGRFEDVIFAVVNMGDQEKLHLDLAQFERLLITLGETQYEMGRAEEAKETFTELLKKKPDSLEARNNLGVIHASEGKLVEAQQMFRSVLEQDPGHLQAKENLKLLQTNDGLSGGQGVFQSDEPAMNLSG